VPRHGRVDEDWGDRRLFDTALRKVIRERSIELIAEEAGDNLLAAMYLQPEEDLCMAVDGKQSQKVEPQDTLGKLVAESLGIPHYDIRPSAEAFPPPHGRDDEYEHEMFEATIRAATLTPAQSNLFLCGDNHRPALAQRFTEAGFETEDRDFVWVRATARG